MDDIPPPIGSSDKRVDRRTAVSLILSLFGAAAMPRRTLSQTPNAIPNKDSFDLSPWVADSVASVEQRQKWVQKLQEKVSLEAETETRLIGRFRDGGNDYYAHIQWIKAQGDTPDMLLFGTYGTPIGTSNLAPMTSCHVALRYVSRQKAEIFFGLGKGDLQERENRAQLGDDFIHKLFSIAINERGQISSAFVNDLTMNNQRVDFFFEPRYLFMDLTDEHRELSYKIFDATIQKIISDT